METTARGLFRKSGILDRLSSGVRALYGLAFVFQLKALLQLADHGHRVKQPMRIGYIVLLVACFLARSLAVGAQPLGQQPITPSDESESGVCAVNWDFAHVVVDADPLATFRINDIQVGDINDDGLPDIWASGRGAGVNAYQMVWYENPTWARYEIAKGDYKYGDLSDIDGDGDLDVIAGQSNDSKVYWFENTGRPEKKDWPKHNLGVDGQPDLFQVGDIDNDGRVDLIFMYKYKVGWAQNPSNPRQKWSTHTIWSGSRRSGGTLADIDQDLDLDIIYGNAWFENPRPKGDPTQASQWIMHTFDPKWPTEARSGIGDLSGDGRLDVVLSGEESTAGIAWYQAPVDLAAGTWIRHDVITSGYEGVHSLALADFDRDGDLDIFAAEMHTGQDPDRVTVFENADIASNTWVEHVLSVSGSHNAKIADLDADGCPDIVGKNFAASSGVPLQVEFWRNTAGNAVIPVDRWQRHIIDSDRPWRAIFIDAGDVNGDGLPDVVAGGWWYENPGRIGDRWTRHEIGGDLYNMALVYDLDGDGDLDILGTKGRVESNDFVWAENGGGGSFTFHTDIPKAKGDFLQGARAAQIVPGGNVEVVLSWHNETSTQMFRIPSRASDRWSWETISSTTNGEQVAIADLDDDGDLDIHLGTAWLRNDGDAWTTVRAFDLGDPDADPDRVELADIDGDGDFDAVIGAEHAKRVVWAEAPANPEERWTEHLISTDVLAMSLDVADLDQDGDIDIVVGEHNDSDPEVGRAIVYRNEGIGSSWSEYEIDAGFEHHDGTRFIDIDKDGDLDVLSIGWFHDQVVIYENRAIAINARGSRATDGLQVLYTFDEGSGTTINDVSGVGEPLNLTVSETTAINWIPGGLSITSPTIINSDEAATKVIRACQASNEITIEAWISPADSTQDGPARIVSLSRDTHNRNFTLGQLGSSYDTRLRTTVTGDNGSSPSLTAGSVISAPSHTVYTRDNSGTARFYVNGGEVGHRNDITGDFSSWDPSFRLALGNELTIDRPWLGELFLVAIYCRALSPLEASQNFDAGIVASHDLAGVLPITGTAQVTSTVVASQDDQTSYENGTEAIRAITEAIVRILNRILVSKP